MCTQYPKALISHGIARSVDTKPVAGNAKPNGWPPLSSRAHQVQVPPLGPAAWHERQRAAPLGREMPPRNACLWRCPSPCKTKATTFHGCGMAVLPIQSGDSGRTMTGRSIAGATRSRAVQMPESLAGRLFGRYGKLSEMLATFIAIAHGTSVTTVWTRPMRQCRAKVFQVAQSSRGK